MKNRQTGFNLIELMIAVGIIGILASIAIPQYHKYVQRTDHEEAWEALISLADLQERYYLQNSSYVAIGTLLADVNTKRGYYTLAADITTPVGGYTLTATAVAGKPSALDVPCTVITLTSAGAKTPTACW